MCTLTWGFVITGVMIMKHSTKNQRLSWSNKDGLIYLFVCLFRLSMLMLRFVSWTLMGRGFLSQWSTTKNLELCYWFLQTITVTSNVHHVIHCLPITVELAVSSTLSTVNHSPGALRQFHNVIAPTVPCVDKSMNRDEGSYYQLSHNYMIISMTICLPWRHI